MTSWYNFDHKTWRALKTFIFGSLSQSIVFLIIFFYILHFKPIPFFYFHNTALLLIGIITEILWLHIQTVHSISSICYDSNTGCGWLSSTTVNNYCLMTSKLNNVINSPYIELNSISKHVVNVTKGLPSETRSIYLLKWDNVDRYRLYFIEHQNN